MIPHVLKACCGLDVHKKSIIATLLKESTKRMLTRYRLAILKQYQAQKNRITKVLETAGIKLGCVASDIFGYSGSLIIKDLIEGKMALQEIAEKRGKRLRTEASIIAKAIDGNLDEEKRYLLSDMNEHLRLLEIKLINLNNKVLSNIEPYRKQWELAQTIPGIDAISAASVIAEIGVDMKQFHNDRRQLSSWAGICPGNNESAGKKKSTKIRKGSKALRRTLCQIANAACKCKGTQFEYFYKSLLIRRGHKKAIVALAHKILRVIFSAFINNKPYYEPKVNYEQFMTRRNAPRWIKALKKYGYIHQEAKMTQS
ncbi:MAG: hypothetical protein A2Y62_07640 [Candidatus Fischerbacteria bacterium RBG_13_37_8]|uniref:Transposase IS116/IS110/IS902 C-terminal domain-containing protein n=1 Tax=Candidatus Fischerbacteria bacterium RBG_13_37_8 TaxID=1817863 RepID=A0A1F5VI46_9BACT|nr:MAG: hypothetical protein A2Y62_07640 [Candidatus Fischerbacteria bacterium RBG_13_37_8]